MRSPYVTLARETEVANLDRLVLLRQSHANIICIHIASERISTALTKSQHT